MHLSLISSLFLAFFVHFSTAQWANETTREFGEENVVDSEEFIGAEHWEKEDRAMCDAEDPYWRSRDAICVTYIADFREIRMEILSHEPALVVYRNLLTPKQVADFLDLLSQKQLEEQKVVDDDGVYMSSKYRRANGTYLAENEHPTSDGIMETVRSSIPQIDFKASEQITAISYHPGGHYAYHNDFLSYPSEQDWDYWMRHFGNRFATLMLIFQPADLGGATVFPALGATLKPRAGDAILWFNTNTDLEMEELTAHAGCPVE